MGNITSKFQSVRLNRVARIKNNTNKQTNKQINKDFKFTQVGLYCRKYKYLLFPGRLIVSIAGITIFKEFISQSRARTIN